MYYRGDDGALGEGKTDDKETFHVLSVYMYTFFGSVNSSGCGSSPE